MIGLPSRLLLDVALPTWDGMTFVGLHQLACWLLERPGDPAHKGQRKPFSITPLQPHDSGPPWSRWGLGLLDGEDEQQRRAYQRLAGHPRLADQHLTVGGIAEQRESYEQLAARPATDRLDVLVRSPTLFSRSGRDYPLPDPALISRHLVARWNTFCPEELAIDEAAARSLGGRIVVVAYAIETVPVELRGRDRAGFVGAFSLAVTGREGEPEHRAACRTLARLGGLLPYSGLGAHTTHGLGTVEVADG